MPCRTSEPCQLGPDVIDEPTDLTEPDRCELVAEAAAIFVEEAARELAGLLRVPVRGWPGAISRLIFFVARLGKGFPMRLPLPHPRSLIEAPYPFAGARPDRSAPDRPAASAQAAA